MEACFYVRDAALPVTTPDVPDVLCRVAVRVNTARTAPGCECAFQVRLHGGLLPYFQGKVSRYRERLRPRYAAVTGLTGSASAKGEELQGL